jgi:hypothetical protein
VYASHDVYNSYKRTKGDADMHFLQLLKTINDNYANVFSFLATVVMIIITAIYVVFTKRQADCSKESNETLQEQFKQQNQPCIVPTVQDTNGVAFDTGTYIRVQFSVDILLKNVGNAPAIMTFTTAEFELQNTIMKNKQKKVIDAAHSPDYVQCVEAQGSQNVNIVFETEEINLLWKDLSITLNKNWKRVKNDPSRQPYMGTNLIIHTFYRNLLGQWYESSISREIGWLVNEKPRPNKTGNINENTYPPHEIACGTKFKAQLNSPHMAPLVFHLVSDEYVNSKLQNYKADNPWIGLPVQLNAE